MSKKKRDIPLFNHAIIETHCHLDYLSHTPIDQILANSSAVGVERLLTISVSPSNLDTVRQLTQDHAQVWGTQGIHPHEAEHYTNETEVAIRQSGLIPKILAIGEIGLDYYYEHAERNTQIEVFEKQLQIACDLDLPIVVHTREADEDTQSILKNYSRQLAKKGVIHSFTSGLKLAEFCLEQGFMLGFNGIITFNKADNVREILKQTPLEQLLVETDAPYLTPAPYRGIPNESKYLPFIIEKIADVKEIDVNHVLQATYRNAQRLFWGEH